MRGLVVGPVSLEVALAALAEELAERPCAVTGRPFTLLDVLVTRERTIIDVTSFNDAVRQYVQGIALSATVHLTLAVVDMEWLGQRFESGEPVELDEPVGDDVHLRCAFVIESWQQTASPESVLRVEVVGRVVGQPEFVRKAEPEPEPPGGRAIDLTGALG